MPSIGFDVLQRRKDAKLDPMLNFKWICESLPFEHDPTYVESIGLPFPEIQQKEGLFGAGTYTYYPGFETISAFDVTFYEDSELNTALWLNAWRERIRRPEDGAYYLPPNYKRDIDLLLLNTENKTIGRAKLVNVWPTTISQWELSYDSGERIQTQANFSCDRIRFNPA